MNAPSALKTAAWRRALVTGASAGIGEAFARRLAAQGADLVLVARDEARLQALADDLKAAHRIQVQVLAADLLDSQGAATVAERLAAEPEIDLLVNNAGMGSKGAFTELPLAAELRQVELNVGALVHLTHAALGAMTRRHRGTVINVSSISGLQPVPTMATYGGTKAFVTSFSEALREEVRGSGVDICVVLPGYVKTEFLDRTGNPEGFGPVPDFAWLAPDRVAADALDDARRRRMYSVAGFGYRVVAGLMGIAPRHALRRYAGLAARHHK
ncbi:SDR family NAD(P)-dependent oxidoreductase [Actinomadura fibrosa]|uniref:SDR family NAD(P)-dependent oxidoreductase n=1 Tax=Actinomadura fibrosa TaxID=111802 RepID=A0ABW2XQ82_9ACTN|nr:SDR family oxidoreductase [Actinomadura fibrosa]